MRVGRGKREMGGGRCEGGTREEREMGGGRCEGGTREE